MRISADDYRARHQLPRTRGLWDQEARKGAGERAKARAGKYPKAVATRLAGTPEEAKRAREAQKESATREGTRRLMRVNIDRNSEAKRVRTKAKYDAMAQQVGYVDIADLMDKNSDATTAKIAQILGISVPTAKWVRRYQVAGFHFEHFPETPATWSAEQLAALTRGEQQITKKHSVMLAQYRRRHGVDGPLVPEQVTAKNQRAVAERHERFL